MYVFLKLYSGNEVWLIWMKLFNLLMFLKIYLLLYVCVICKYKSLYLNLNI